MKTTSLCAAVLFLLLAACASLKERSIEPSTEAPKKKITAAVYLAGGLGNSSNYQNKLTVFQKVLASAGDSTAVLFLGDNLLPVKDPGSDQQIAGQSSALKDYKGKAWFLPGDYEWKYKDNNKMAAIQTELSVSSGNRKIYRPENGCPLSSVSVNENLQVIFIDSEWYLSDWDEIKGINQQCPDIKTRRRFIDELENIIKDNAFKNIIIAIHHPIFSNGKHGGKYSAADHLKPFPVAGSVSISLKKLGGIDSQDNSSKRYRELISEVAALSKLSDRITIVSGHEQSMQYLEGGGIHQVISGSLGGSQAVNLSKGTVNALGGNLEYHGVYGTSQNGYAKLNYYDDGSSTVEFFSADGNMLYRHGILKPLPILKHTEISDKAHKLPSSFKAQILSDKETDKSGFYKFLWGKHYRYYYSLPVTAKTALLDTLYGGLHIIKEGGGHQSQSIRLEGQDGKQYIMRSLRKDAMKFLRFKIKGSAFDSGAYENTAAENLVEDFFTTAHPYVQLSEGILAQAALINHTNTNLYYFPQQQALGGLSDKYGDALYFVQQRPSSANRFFEGFQFATEHKELPIKEFVSTTEVFEKLRLTDQYSVDQRQYVRSRIFDMLLGDWDRHEDQWRWAYRETGKNQGVFSPIPRDRDAAFSKFDGVALGIIKRRVPETRFWQTYDGDLHDVKWFNSEAYMLDKIFLSKAGKNMWQEEARSIRQKLNAAVIDQAFKTLPPEVQDSTLDSIKSKLKQRLSNLEKIAVRYGEFIGKQIVVYGTEQDDVINIIRTGDGKTQISIYTASNNKLQYSNTFNTEDTEEILLYGLNGDDRFTVSGEGRKEIMLRMIGGYGTDHYTISDASKTRVYDYDYEQNIFAEKKPAKKQLSSIYETNNLHFRFFSPNNNVLLPSLGYATDDGFFLGFKDIYTNKGFNGSPYRQQHKFYGHYYFSYQSVEAGYNGIFANVFPKVDFFADAYYTDDHFSNNFFGYGNQTLNNDDVLGKDYNRARTRQGKLNAGLSYKSFKLAATFESYKVQQTPDRYFSTANFNPSVFENQNYLGSEISFNYRNRDAEDFPTSGLYSNFTAGWKTNIEKGGTDFGYIDGKVGFDQKLTSKGNLVVQSTIAAKILFGEGYNFYQSASIGGDNGLRGYRNERFSGGSYLYDSSNLKLRIRRFRTSFIPFDFGIYGGFDCGRVWADEESSHKWHTSQGGGLWIGGLSMSSLQAGFFNSDEGNIVFIGLNFKY